MLRIGFFELGVEEFRLVTCILMYHVSFCNTSRADLFQHCVPCDPGTIVKIASVLCRCRSLLSGQAGHLLHRGALPFIALPVDMCDSANFVSGPGHSSEPPNLSGNWELTMQVSASEAHALNRVCVSPWFICLHATFAMARTIGATDGTDGKCCFPQPRTISNTATRWPLRRPATRTQGRRARKHHPYPDPGIAR